MGDFHFIRPAWLLAWPVLLALVAWLAQRQSRQGQWSALVDASLLPLLRLSGAAAGAEGAAPGDDGAAVRNRWASLRRAARAPWPWLALAWSLAVLALAGPTWEREPSVAFHAPAAWVLVLDLSPSMNATDVPPSRIRRARFAVDDLIAAAQGARVGLVAFSDEPYTVAPLTDDTGTLRALVPPLSPELMPSAGDQLAPALTQAGRLLESSGARGGQVVVLTDGFADPAAALAAAGRLRDRGATLDVVAIGTRTGAPQLQPDGSFVQDAQGRPQMARLDTELMQRLAAAGGGRAVDLADLPQLIQRLQAQSRPVPGDKDVTASGLRAGRWQEAGVWLLPLLLVLVAMLARRGWL
jgi:Ca-activated chloride channel family protein